MDYAIHWQNALLALGMASAYALGAAQSRKQQQTINKITYYASYHK